MVLGMFHFSNVLFRLLRVSLFLRQRRLFVSQPNATFEESMRQHMVTLEI